MCVELETTWRSRIQARDAKVEKQKNFYTQRILQRNEEDYWAAFFSCRWQWMEQLQKKFSDGTRVGENILRWNKSWGRHRNQADIKSSSRRESHRARAVRRESREKESGAGAGRGTKGTIEQSSNSTIPQLKSPCLHKTRGRSRNSYGTSNNTLVTETRKK